jgi:Tol biopolymer transport system component
MEEGGQLSFYALEAADLCLSDVNKHDQVRLTNDSGGDWHPAWSPDGSQIAYLREDGIYLIAPDGRNRRQLLSLQALCTQLDCPPVGKAVNMTWSPAGDYLLLSGCLEHSDRDIYLLATDTGTVTNLTPDSRTDDLFPMWTLDGAKIVFLSADSLDPSSQYSCRWDLYDASPQLKVMNADGSGEAIVGDDRFDYPFVSVSNNGLITFVRNGDLRRMDLGGRSVESPSIEEYYQFPIWSPNGEYLAYEWPSRSINILDVETGEVFESQIEGESSTPIPLIDSLVWSPDSQRIAVIVSIRKNYAIDSEQHIYVFDVESGILEPLILE